MADIKDNPIINYAAQQAQTQADTLNNINDIHFHVAVANMASDDEIASADQAGQDQQVIAAQQDATALDTSNKKAAAQAALGADPASANYRLSKLAADRDSNYEAAINAQKVIAVKQQMTLLNNPLGYIQAQFTLPADIAVFNNFATLHNMAENEYDGIVASSNATAQEINANAATMTASEAAARQDSIIQQTQQSKDKLLQQNMQFNLQGSRDLQSMTDSQLRNAASAVSVQAEESRMQMQREQFAAASVSRQLTQQVLNEKLDDIANQNDQLAAYQLAVDNGHAPVQNRAQLISNLKKNDPDTKHWLDYGYNVRLNSNSKEGVPVAPNAATAAQLYNGSKINPVGTEAPTMKWVTDAYNTIVGADPQIAAQKDPAIRAELANNRIVAGAVQMQGAIKDGDAKNIYAAPPVATILSSSPAVRDNAFITGVVAPLLKANPTQPTNANFLFQAAATTVTEDPTQLDTVAAGITTYFAAANQYNNKMKSYAENGLPLQRGYMASLATGLFGSSSTYDLTNPLVVKKLLMTSILKNPANMGAALAGLSPN